MRWRKSWELATIPEGLLRSEWGRRNSYRRLRIRGGRKITCECGRCRKCRNREAKRRQRLRERP